MTSTKLSTCLLPLSAWSFLAAPLCAATVTMTGATNSVWTTPATWSDALAPSAANDYTVSSLTLNAPSLTTTATATFDGKSLTVTGGGISFPGTSGGTVTHTYNFPNLSGPVAVTNSALAFSSSNSTTKSVGAALSFSGANTISYTSSNFTHNLTFAQPLSGTGTLTFNWSGVATGRNVNVNGTGNNYTGSVVLNNSSGPANFNLTQPLGAAAYEVRNSWRLNNNNASGLDAATAIGVFDSSSLLNLAQPWNNAAGALAVHGGNVTFGPATTFSTSSIGSLVHDGGTLQFDIGSGSGDKLALSGNFNSTNGFIDVYLKSDPGTQTYDLITYGGTLTGTPAPAVATPTRLVPNFSNGDGSNDKVTVTFTGPTANLVWKGNDITSPNNWDTNTTTNFDNAGTPDLFLAIDSVTFNDTAASFTPNLIGTVLPKAVTFNNAANAYTLGGTGTISGSATLMKNGAADLTINVANAHTGGTTLNAGKIRIGNNAALGTGTLVINGGTLSGNDGDTTATPAVNGTARTLSNPVTVGGSFTLGNAINNGAVNLSGPITLAANATINAESATEMTLSGIISGTGNLEYLRAATSPVARLNLNNTGNTFAGNITITSGRLRFASGAASDGAFGNGSNKIIFNGAPVENFNSDEGASSLQQSSAGAGTIGATREVILNTGKEGTLQAWGSQTFTVNAPITGGGRLRKGDAGTLLLAGNNSYSGGTRVTNGIVRVTNNTGLGSGDVTVGAVNNTLTARVDLEGVTVANNFVLNSLGLTGFFGPLTAGGGTLSTVNGDVTISSGVGNGGHLASNGAGSVLRVNGAVIALNNVVPNVRQGTVILAGGGSYPRLDQGQGTLQIGANNGIASGAQLRLGVSADGTFDLNGFNQTLSQLNRAASSNATVTNTAVAPSVLTIDGATDHSFSGTLTESAGAGGLSLVKKGSSIFTLAAGSSYTGSTSVEGGKLVINAATGVSPITVAANGTLGGTGDINGSIAVAGTLAPGNAVGKMFTNSSVTFGPGSTYAWEIGDWSGTEAGTGWDLVDALDLSLTATPANKLTIVISGPVASFSETAKTFEIARSTNPITGFNPAAIQIDDSAFVGTGTWSVQANGNAIELVYAAGSANPFNTWASANGVTANAALDSDSDGIPNGIEFVIGGNPAPGAGSDSHALLPTITTDVQYLNFTYRRTDEAAGMPEAQQPYVQYGSSLTGWVTAEGGVDGIIISEVNGTPDLVTVKIPRSLAGNGKLFARLRVDIE